MPEALGVLLACGNCGFWRGNWQLKVVPVPCLFLLMPELAGKGPELAGIPGCGFLRLHH